MFPHYLAWNKICEEIQVVEAEHHHELICYLIFVVEADLVGLYVNQVDQKGERTI